MYPKNIFQDWTHYFGNADVIMEKFFRANESMIKTASQFPPYNIKKVDHDKYEIEMAIAGFGRQDLEIELDGDALTVRSSFHGGDELDEGYTYPYFMWRGLAKRAFQRQFALHDNIRVQGATMFNGVLRIMLEAIAKDETPVKIDIQEDPADAPIPIRRKAAKKKPK